jgi:hypothetical protein
MAIVSPNRLFLHGSHCITFQKTTFFTDFHIVFLRNVRLLLVKANALSSPILVILMMEAVRSSETSVLARATLFEMPENGILHSYRCENFKSFLDFLYLSLQKYRNQKVVEFCFVSTMNVMRLNIAFQNRWNNLFRRLNY